MFFTFLGFPLWLFSAELVGFVLHVRAGDATAMAMKQRNKKKVLCFFFWWSSISETWAVRENSTTARRNQFPPPLWLKWKQHPERRAELHFSSEELKWKHIRPMLGRSLCSVSVTPFPRQHYKMPPIRQEDSPEDRSTALILFLFNVTFPAFRRSCISKIKKLQLFPSHFQQTPPRISHF